MITYYRTNHGALETIDKPEPGCWINVYEPTEKELGWLSQSLDISPNFLSKAFDEEESAHADVDPDNDQVLVIVDCPYVVSEDCQHGKKITQYDTLPISFIFIPKEKYLLTLSLHHNEYLDEFAKKKGNTIDTAHPQQFLLKTLLFICEVYLHSLRVINRQIHEYEKLLRKRINDSDLLVMLDFEKSLIYFTTSLQGLRATVSHVEFKETVHITSDEDELLDNVKIEIAQASEMCNIYTDILEGITDAFSNVLNNNLNTTMRILTGITIILAMPTIIFSFYGMNVAARRTVVVPRSDSGHPLRDRIPRAEVHPHPEIAPRTLEGFLRAFALISTHTIKEELLRLNDRDRGLVLFIEVAVGASNSCTKSSVFSSNLLII